VTAQPIDVPDVPARQASRLVELNNCLSLDDLPGRDLTPAELAELAASIAAQPHLWEDQVAYSAAPGRERRRVADLLDPRERHRLA